MASPSWVILDTVPRVSAAGEVPPGGAISLALAAPPRVTRLTVGPIVFPADPDTDAEVPFPSILAADRSSGLLLAIAPPSMSERPPEELRVWPEPDGSERTFRVRRVSDPAYLVLDVPACAASRVPDVDDLNASSLGVIASPAGAGRGYMVVGFQNIVGCCEADLVCFSSETGEWVEKEVANPMPEWIWDFHEVVAHDGNLWWVDRAAGLLACDPFADEPDMAHVPLPKGGKGKRHRGCGYCSERTAASRRCVKISNGKFRCVEVGGCASKGEAPKLTMRTLVDPKKALWTLEYQVSFAEIWASESYKAAGLPEQEPVVALVHPKNPDVVYFFLEEYIFGVDVPARKVVECAAHELDVLESDEGGVSSSSVLAWDLPPTLTRRFAGAGL